MSASVLTTVPGSLRGPEDTDALAIADHAPPPFSRLFNEPSKIRTLFTLPYSPSAGELFTGHSSASIIEHGGCQDSLLGSSSKGLNLGFKLEVIDEE